MSLGGIMNDLILAINSLASIGFYDWLIFLVTLVGVFVAAFVAKFTYEIYHKQLSLMTEQKTISDKQSEIMIQQNKIVLFEKRYELYQNLNDFHAFLNMLILDENNKSQDIFSLYPILQELKNDDCGMLYLQSIKESINKTEFLFELENNQDLFCAMTSELTVLIYAITQFDNAQCNEKMYWYILLTQTRRDNLIQFNDSLKEYLNLMKEQLKLKNSIKV